METRSANVGLPFTFEEQWTARGTAIVRLHGEADLYEAPLFRDRLTELVDAGAKRMVVDLTEVTFVDSMMLGVLLGFSKRFRSAGGLLRLVVARREIGRLLEITLLDHVFEIDPTLEAAISAIEGPSERA